MRFRLLILIVVSLALVSLRPHSFTDRPRQDDRPMALGDFRESVLSCSEDFCQDFEYSGGCTYERGWPVTATLATSSGLDCNWDGDGVTSGTNALYSDASGGTFRVWNVVDASGTAIPILPLKLRMLLSEL